MRKWLAIAFALLVAGCGKSSPPAAPESSGAGADAAQAGQATVSLSGPMEFSLFDKEQAQGGAPTFRLFSPMTTLSQEGVWAFERAAAAIYGSDGMETRIQSGEGEFARGDERVVLRKGAALEMGALQVRLEDLVWSNKEQVARSENPVHLEQGEMALDAASLEFHPKTNVLVLTDVAGIVPMQQGTLGGAPSGETPAQESKP